ncbi:MULTISPECIES: PD40 domain-containing protein [Corallococcus]|nr:MULTISPECIES: PD40 domain-containing protein [Corallococcus]
MMMGRSCILGAVLLTAACGVSNPEQEVAEDDVTAKTCLPNCPPPTKIAFASNRGSDPAHPINTYDIFVMGTDGTVLTRLTSDLVMDRRPKLNKARTRVVWQRDYGQTSPYFGDFEIVAANIDGSNMQRLTNWEGDDEQPAFSPDGTRIVFAHCASRCSLYLMDANGEHRTLLATDLQGSGSYLTPSFSPDGLKVVFGYEALSTSDIPFRGIYRINVDGTGLVRLNEGPSDWTSFFPVYNAAGTKIAFTASISVQGLFERDLYSMNADGTGLVALQNGPEDDQCPAYSPTADTLVFERLPGGTSSGEIFMRSVNGTLTNLTNTVSAHDVEPSWQ